MFLLADYLVRNKKAAFIAGLIFAFCPYKFAHLSGHWTLAATEWIPFYVLFLIKMTRPGETRGGIKNSLLAGIFLLLVALSDYYYLNFAILFTIFYWIYVILTQKNLIHNKVFPNKLAIMILIPLAGLLPVLFSAFNDFVYGSYAFGGLKDYCEFVSDLAGFVTPGFYSPFFRKYVFDLYTNIFTGGVAENNVFIGYTVLILGFYGIYKYYSHRELRFWLYSAVLFFVLSLGPLLHIYGKEYPVYLPGWLLVWIPGLNGMRVFSRFSLMGMFSLSIFIAYACNFLFQRFQNKVLLMPAIALLIFFEYLPAPYPIHKVSIPQVYSIIAQDNEDCLVLEIPLKWFIVGSAHSSVLPSNYMFCQTVHNKRLISGHISRGSATLPDHYLDMPLLNKLYCLQENIPFEKFYKEADAKSLLQTINFLNIKYIIIHKQEANQKVLNYFENQFFVKKEMIFNDKEIIAYRIAEKAGGYNVIPENIVRYSQGWSDRQMWGEKYLMHWSRGRKSLLTVDLNEPSGQTISMDAIPFPLGTNKQSVKVFINNKLLTEQRLSAGWRAYSIPVPASFWKAGTNNLNFSYTLVESPENIYNNSTDKRFLAMGISNIRITGK